MKFQTKNNSNKFSYSQKHSVSKKSQTATEYLIILAVVIVIALIVVGVLGGIPSIGGGLSEQAAKSQLMSAQVGVTNFVVSEAKTKFQFVNNLATTIRIDNVTVDGKECFLIGSNSNPALTPILKVGEKKTISCGSATADAGTKYNYDLTITYTDLSNNAQYTINELQLVGTSSSFACPEGFIPVPGGFILADGSTVDDFCVMKYEAKEDSSGLCPDGKSNNCPVSVAAGTPWVSINQTDAILECQSLGAGYDLISDQQWMVMAENILNTPINDLNSSAEGPQLANGNSAGAAIYSAGTDPTTLGCDLSKSLDDPVNNYSLTCQVRGTGNDFGYTSDGASSWNMVYDTTADSRAKLRTHILSNGKVVWDLAGNAWELTKTQQNLENSFSESGYYSDIIDFSGVEWAKPSLSLDSSYGFGRYNVYETGQTPYPISYRGGMYSGPGSSYASIFGLSSMDPSSDYTTLTFRCTYSP